MYVRQQVLPTPNSICIKGTSFCLHHLTVFNFLGIAANLIPLDLRMPCSFLVNMVESLFLSTIFGVTPHSIYKYVIIIAHFAIVGLYVLSVILWFGGITYSHTTWCFLCISIFVLDFFDIEDHELHIYNLSSKGRFGLVLCEYINVYA